MKYRILTAVSALAILAAIPAIASEGTATDPAAGTGTETQTPQAEGGVEGALNSAGKAASDAAGTVTDAVQEAYYDLRQELTGENKDFVQAGPSISIPYETTAAGMIGKDVADNTGNAVAKLEDIVLDPDGKAQMVVLRDGGIFGMGGKLVALDYKSIMRQEENGDIIMPVTEEMLDQAKEFTYEASETGENRQVLPAGGVSIAKLMDGEILTPQGTEAAGVDNLTLKGGEAEYVVISFGETLGVGGDKAVMQYDDLEITPAEGGDVNFTLTEEQAATVENFKMQLENAKS